MAHILVVEDDPAVASTLCLLLESEGHEVRIASNGQEGLQEIRKRMPDLTISDIEMPVLDGPGMALRLFIEDQGRENIPIIVLSGFPDVHAVARKIGTPYYLSKPFSIETLYELVNRALAERLPPVPAEGRDVG